MKMNLRITSLVSAMCLALCSAANAQLANAAAKPGGGGGGGGSTPTPTPSPNPTGYTGRIVYSASGTLHMFDLATGVDTSLNISGVNPKFSVQGDKIVFQSNSGIKIMSSTPPYNPQLLSATGGVPSFDPFGTFVVYSDSGVIKRVNADGSSTAPVTLRSSGYWPTYSSDGTQIAFGAGNPMNLWVMNADGTSAHPAVATSGAVIDTVWSPGPGVVMGVQNGSKAYQLSTYLNGALTVFTSSSKSNDEPSWSPDGQYIAYTCTGLGGICITNANASDAPGHLVIPGGRQCSWGLPAPTPSPAP